MLRLPFARRSPEDLYFSSAATVLGLPGARRVTPLAVLMAHGIAAGQGRLQERTGEDRDALLLELAALYGADLDAVWDEKEAAERRPVPRPALSTRRAL